MQSENFDIIVAGSGMAGLSLVYRALKERVWVDERILIIDRDRKDKNDRTWCFWQKENDYSPFQDVICSSWKNLSCFTNSGKQITLQRGDYAYNMIRSTDFYRLVISFLEQNKQVTFFCDDITGIRETEDGGIVETATKTFTAKFIFNSVYNKPVLNPTNQYFLQHFKGIRIQTNQYHGNPSEMNLMDFRTTQEHGTTFFYVLPISSHEIFLEYTIFSKELLPQEEYDVKITEYLKAVLKITDYKILESEFGFIPMTDYKFKRRFGNIMQIGTAGGDTRASTGYTFRNVQKTVSKILESYSKNGHPFFTKENINLKHAILDSTILNVLDKNQYPGHEIFSGLFDKVEGKTVFAFLDSESQLQDDLKIMSSLRPWPFIGPFFKVLYNRFF